jgi:hypothetical protein
MEMHRMNQIGLSVVLGAIIVAAAVLYSSGSLTRALPEAEHRAAVREQLVDPESARFRGERRHPLLNVHCGEVNGRNRMGGFAGWQGYTAFGPVGDLGWRVNFHGPQGAPFDACR